MPRATVDKPKKKKTKKEPQLNVRVSEDLLRLVNTVAGATGKSQSVLVSEILEKRLKKHVARVKDINSLEEEMNKSYDWKRES